MTKKEYLNSKIDAIFIVRNQKKAIYDKLNEIKDKMSDLELAK